MTSRGVPMDLLRGMRGSGATLTVAPQGASMLPLIREGDRIDVRFDPVDDIRAGDILLFERGGRMILHRVIRRMVQEGSIVFLEKGDHHLLANPLPADAVLGRVVRIRRGDGVFDLESFGGRWIRRGLLWGATVDAALPALRRWLLGDRPSRAGAWWRRASRLVRGRLIRIASGFRGTK